MKETPRPRLVLFTTAVVALVLCFAWPLFRLVEFAASSDLYSYIILVPFISLYLVWINRKALPPLSPPDRQFSIPCSIVSIACAAGYWVGRYSGLRLEIEDSLSITIVSFVLFLWGICGWFLGRSVLRSIAFPMGFLILMAPLPSGLRMWIESQLQYYSAMSALGMFTITGMPVLYGDLTFQLTDITLRVAPECSGIHSTFALIITSLLAGHFFLRSNWRRGTLALSVLPLAVLRNGFRIFTIGELCVHIGPQMIDSRIHHHGGPIFFILSLVPFLILLFYLVRSERPTAIQNAFPHES